MLTQNQFNVLTTLQANPQQSQRILAQQLNCSVGTINKVCQDLRAKGLIDDSGITPFGEKKLSPYRVDNAVIMAAGMSSRFVPISLEKPKALLEVKGEILIERQIRQLQEVGITDIAVVVGYLKEQFFYLEEKFGVTIIVNEDYYRYNNTSTLIRVIDKLKNTYLCSSDNYFTQNIFEKYVYRSYYSTVFSQGETNEYCVSVEKNGRINAVTVGGENSWYMLGHVYFTREFSEKFIDILQKEYINDKVKTILWEDLYIQNIDKLDLFIKKYDSNIVYEFDSLDELREFDPLYINNADSSILKNITCYFSCSVADIVNIVPIKKGMTNISFSFELFGKKYVYRHPGKGTELYINRKSEFQALTAAKTLGIDSTFLYMNPEEGWKISEYKENARNLVYGSAVDTSNALAILRTLHNAQIQIDYEFDVWDKINSFISALEKHGKSDFADFNAMYDVVKKVYECTVKDNFPKHLCHCDSFDPNFMIHCDGIDLIDWEYAGNSDVGIDLGTFIVCNPNNNYEYAINIIQEYYGNDCTDQKLRHNIAYCALASYCWYLWALYQESLGQAVGEYLLIWYKGAKLYAQKALLLYAVSEG